MFTKQHFEAIAEILKPYRERNYHYPETEKAIDEIIGDFAEYLKDTNPLFDAIRFLKACGYGN